MLKTFSTKDYGGYGFRDAVSVEYDDELWEVISEPFADDDMQFVGFLHWKGKSLVCDLPKGLYSCVNMFYGVEFPEGFRFGNFDITNVKNMIGMFREAKFCRGFTLGDKFTPNRCEAMGGIFAGTVFNDDFIITGRSYVEPKDELCETTGISGQEYYGGYECLFSEKTVLPKSIREYLVKNIPITHQEHIILFLMHENHEYGWQYDMWGTINTVQEWAWTEGNMTVVYGKLSQRAINYFESVYRIVYCDFVVECNHYLKDLLSNSSVTIGEAIKRIQEKSIPDDIIYKCTCEYLSDQVVVPD